jgi:hypothetical protein
MSSAVFDLLIFAIYLHMTVEAISSLYILIYCRHKTDTRAVRNFEMGPISLLLPNVT